MNLPLHIHLHNPKPLIRPFYSHTPIPKPLIRPFQSHTPIPKPTKHPSLPFSTPPRYSSIKCLSSDIDMFQTKPGLFIPKPTKVVVLWDLDNKPPRGPPYDAALRLKSLAERFGTIIEISAYANRHAFSHLPTWVLQQRAQRRQLDSLERKGLVTPPPDTYICNVCGRKCKTHLALKKHFRELHERERQKKLSRMRHLKGKKRRRYKERYIEQNWKYEEGARRLITPKVGYGLERELRRGGVDVRTVEDKPQAADWALKRQMMHSMRRGIDWMVLVSDDSDFREILIRAREAELGTIVVGDGESSLGRFADLWVPWSGVETGEIREEDFVLKRSRGEVDVDVDVQEDEELFQVDLDRIVNEVVGSSGRGYDRSDPGFLDREDEWYEYDKDYDVDDDDDHVDGYGDVVDSEDELEEE